MARSKWETNVKDKLVLVEGWARNGLTEQQIAKNLGIAYSTFKEYKKKYPALSAVLKKGKDVIDFEVESALIKRALGYEYEEEIKEIVVNEETGVAELRVVKTVKKKIAPDVTAQIFWLKNRKPEEWKNDPHKVKIDLELLKLRQKELELKGW
ncbi:transposase [Terrisporobacter hibernicus]|uniref:Transposase n=1 Tax=Terrisporobacter hibernicus TaxID=2813371 RepID=A0AAX2ZEB3_9FIRM|nr:transposase [Terrisporobacter hibernicus]UEL47346.1 transposase [Terrisporobacter hibernicus]